jgi:hypothetical protein
MERAEILQHLTQVESAIQFGTERVRQHRNLIAELQRDGQEGDAAFERVLLATLENSLRLDLDDQRRTTKQLSDFDRGQT